MLRSTENQTPEDVDEEQVVQHRQCQDSRLYGDTIISGHAHVHLGDVINHYPRAGQPSKQVYEPLLESLTFDRMDARLRNVAAALPTTCQWLLSHDYFTAWSTPDRAREHNGFLWIKGHPGAGKSSIMRETLLWAEKQWSSEIVISYFFNARASGLLEKSSLGLYQSLTYQLLNTHASPRELFEKSFCLKISRSNVIDEWTEIELQNFWLELLTTCEMPMLNIFIDALDEGDDDDVRQMVEFLEELAHQATEMARPLRICLSSRHYPYISIKKGLSLVIDREAGHMRDINLYIRRKLKRIGGAQMSDIYDRIRDKSSGVFLWVVLVIPPLTKAYEQGKTVVAMRKKLEETPSNLYELFSGIFSRDSDEFDECIKLLRWVMYMSWFWDGNPGFQRTLNPKEIYHAVYYTSPSTDALHFITPDPETLERWLVAISRGLVEVTKEGTVQFIHETVRDYLTKERFGGQRALGGAQGGRLIPVFQADICQQEMAEDCLHYLFNVSTCAPLGSEECYPLACYAARTWLEHAQWSNSPCNERLLSLAMDLLVGDRRKFLVWKHYLIGYEIMCDMDSPLECAVYIGKPEILQQILRLRQDRDSYTGVESVDAALGYASELGNVHAVQVLLDHGANANETSALPTAAERDLVEIVQTLLENGADANVIDEEGRDALHHALRNRRTVIVELLLKHGADVDKVDEHDETPLHYASRYDRTESIRLLLKYGADVNKVNKDGKSPLFDLVRYGRTEMVQLLLKHGADVNKVDKNGQSPLFEAVRYSETETVHLLLEHGADINTADKSGRTSLYFAVRTNTEIVQVLLEHGAEHELSNPRRQRGRDKQKCTTTRNIHGL